MDLFETLGVSIGGRSVADQIDSLRVTSDARAIEALHEPAEPELKDYGVTVELTLSAFSEQDATEFVQYLLERAKMPPSAVFDIERVIEL